MSTAVQSRRTHPTAERSERVAALDGVRGLAVLAVLFFHTKGEWLSAGYLGVDVFFVLSGFLITDILVRQMPSLRVHELVVSFWLRRARRLAPALLVLVGVISLLRLIHPTPGTTERSPIFAALTYTTNWYEIVRGGTYFGQFGEPSLLFHTWSLAIEEQFYLAFPLVLAVLVGLIARSRGRAIILFALAIVSAVWMAFLVTTGASELRVYMGTDTRAQALLIGAALGVLVPARTRETRSLWPQWLGASGAVIVFALMVVIGDYTQLMTGGFFLVAMGAAFMIWASIHAGPVSKVLSWRPIVGVGAISYSVYLWHYPIFAWIQGPAGVESPVGAQIWSVMATLLVAWASYRLVEQPILRGRFTRLRPARQWVVYLSVAGLLAATGFLPPGMRTEKPSLTWPDASTVPGSIMMMGDSTAFEAQLSFPSDVYPETVVGGPYKIGCGFSKLPYRDGGAIQDVAECQIWRERTVDFQAQWRPQAVVVHNFVWDVFDRVVDGEDYPPGTAVFDEDFAANLAEVIRLAGKDGTSPVYVVKTECVAAVSNQEILNDSQRRRTVNRLIDAVVASLPNTYAVETSDLTCREGRPLEEFGDYSMRRDGIHWSTQGVRSMWQLVLTRMAVDYESQPNT